MEPIGGGGFVDRIKQMPMWVWAAVGIAIIAVIVIVSLIIYKVVKKDSGSTPATEDATPPADTTPVEDTQTPVPPPPPPVTSGPSPAAVQPIAGYTFYPGYDSSGNDISHDLSAADNYAKLSAACNANTACKGFNTNGWYKKAVTDPSKFHRWTTDPKKGLFVRQ